MRQAINWTINEQIFDAIWRHQAVTYNMKYE